MSWKFLLNVRKDLESYPDDLYDSENLNRYNVSRGDIMSVSTMADLSSTLELRASNNHMHWLGLFQV